MKQLKFFALITAFVFAMASLSACGKDKDKDDDSDDDYGKKGKADTSVVKSRAKDRARAEAPAKATLGDDFESNMSYLEDNAPSFFPGLEDVMSIVRESMNGQEPTVEEQEEMKDFMNSHQQYFEAFGVVLGYEMSGSLTPEQSERAEAYAEQYPQGMEDMQLLLQIGMAATQMQ